jgi:hypothetical protein
MTTDIIVRQIEKYEAQPWILKKHYAKRMCQIQYAFGAFRGSEMVGIVTYGLPASPPLCKGICGEEWASNVIELNRLCCYTIKDLASKLVGRSLKLLPKPTIVVSYADSSQGHVGYVYQATNFIYTGLSVRHLDWTIEGLECIHGRSTARMAGGKGKEFLKEKYGEKFKEIERPRKHRYIYFVGSKSQIKKLRSCLKYPVMDYPKGNSRRYDASNQITTQTSFF